MQRKRVLFLASWYPSRENISLGNFVQRHAEAANEIADITVLYAVSSKKNTSIEFVREKVNGVDTLIVYYPKVKSNIPVLRQLFARSNYLKALKQGFSHLKTDFDLVHLNAVFPAGLFALYLKKKFSLNYIVTVHWTGYLNHTRTFQKLPFYTKASHKRIFSNSSKVLPVSDHLGISLIDLNLIEEYQVVPNVVNEKIFFPPQKKEINKAPRFLHVSSFNNEHKNISGMLKSFKSMQDEGKDFLLHLITEGSESEVWKAISLFDIEKDRCIVKEKASPNEVAEAMRQADCFVLFSNYETFSVVMAEAWMTGIPIIYSRCGGLTEVQNPYLGVQIKKGDVEGLSEALKSFRSEDYRIERVLKAVDEFNLKSVEQRLSNCYNKL